MNCRRASFALLVTGFLAVAFGAPGISLAQQGLYNTAKEYFDHGKYSAALVEIKNILQANPDDVEARILLGKIYLRSGDPKAAETAFLRARELGAGGEDLELMLAYSRLQQQRYKDVLGDVPSSIQLESDIQKDLFVARGEALIGLGKLQAAEEVFDRVLKAGPNFRALVGKAQIAMIVGDQAKARSLLDQAKSLAPNEALVAVTDAEWLFREKRYEEAKKEFDRAIKLDSGLLRAYLGKLQSLIALNEIDQAQALLKDLKASNPDSLAVILQDAVLQFRIGNYKQAKISADRVLAQLDDIPQALAVAGYSAYQLEDYEQARARLTQYLSQRPDDNQARAALGATMLKLGNSKEALSTLKGVPGEVPDDVNYLGMLTNAAVATGDLKAAAGYLEQLAAKKPDDAGLQRRLGQARVAARDLEGATAAFERSVKLQPDNIEGYAQLFTVWIQRGNTSKALEIAKKVQTQFPSVSTGQTMVGLAYLAAGERAEAKRAFQKAMETDPGNVEAAGNLAKLLTLDGEVDNARSVLDKALTAKPGDLKTLLTYADIETSVGDQAKAVALLKKAVEQNPKAASPRIRLGDIELRNGHPAETLKLTEPILADGGKTLKLLETVGLARMQVQDHNGAVEAFRTMTELAPNNAKAHEYLMLALERNGQISEALTEANRVLELDPKVTPAQFGKARYLAQLGRLNEAKAVLEPLKKQFPDDVQILTIDGRIALVEKRFNDAAAAFEKAFKLRHNNYLLMELVRAKLMAGEQDQAIAMMQAWVQEHPKDLLVRTSLADSYIKAGDLENARGELHTIVKLDPNDARSKNSLAEVLLDQGKAQDAAPLAKQAHDLDPKNPAFADTLGVALLKTGEKKEALRILSAAREAARNSRAIQLHFSEALAENGETEQAVTELQNLLQEAGDFPEKAEAEKLLARLQE